MKKLFLLVSSLLISLNVLSQVGIGTLVPNPKSLLELSSTSKGFLLPRMTLSQRTALNPTLTSAETGLMVYQTDISKGVYTWDGTKWIYYAPMDAGTANGQTLRWDGSKWAAVSNLFNQGTSIGIGTQNPNAQLQIHSNGVPTTRIQLTNTTTGALVGDGLYLGVNLSDGSAHLIQQENKSLSFFTDSIDRIHIDADGEIGIGITNPGATLDVNGTVKVAGQTNFNGINNLNGTTNANSAFNANSILNSNGIFNANAILNANAAFNANSSFKLGNNGTVLQSIIRMDYEINPPLLIHEEEWPVLIPCPNSNTNAVVYVSPGAGMPGMMIAYSRVSTAGTIEVKIMNMGPDSDPGPVTLHIAVIQ